MYPIFCSNLHPKYLKWFNVTKFERKKEKHLRIHCTKDKQPRNKFAQTYYLLDNKYLHVIFYFIIHAMRMDANGTERSIGRTKREAYVQQ